MKNLPFQRDGPTGPPLDGHHHQHDGGLGDVLQHHHLLHGGQRCSNDDGTSEVKNYFKKVQVENGISALTLFKVSLAKLLQLLRCPLQNF